MSHTNSHMYTHTYVGAIAEVTGALVNTLSAALSKGGPQGSW